MGTLGDKFSYLIATKNLMKTVLRNKGQSVSDDTTFRSYVDKINNLVPPPSGTINIGQNGAHDVSNYANANVSVQPTLQTKNVSPSTSQQSIIPDQNYDGLSEVTVGAVDNTIDNNIVSCNIKSGVTILGVSGSSSVVDTDDADAEAINIRKDRTAYVKGQKITGTLPVLTYPSGDFDSQFIAGDSVYTKNRDNKDYLVGTYQVASGSQPDSWMFEGNRKMKLGIPYNLVANKLGITAGKIKKGETIAGVTGTYTSDATATAGDIVKGKTAYVNGSKVTGTYDISAEELMVSYMAINALPFNHNIYQIFSDMAQDGTADYSLHTITYSPTDVYMYLDYIKTYEWIYLMSFPYAPEIVGTLQSLYTSSVSSYYFYHDASYYNFNGTTSIEITQGIYKVTFTVIISNDRISNVSLSVYNTSTNITEYSVSANINFTPGGGDMPTTIQGDGDTVSKAIYMMLKNTPISNIKITSSALNSSSDIERICNECAHLIDDYIKLITETE